MNGGKLFAVCLKEQGVEWISGLCGNGLNDLLAGCREVGIRVIDTRNEQAAAYMAESWGRLSGKGGVCAVSSGVAHANGMTGVVNAYYDGAPMLLVSGAGPLATTGMGHFQDLDQVALAAPVCKQARLVDSVERIPEFVHGAFAAALRGRPGPVHLTVPMDVLAAEVEGIEPWAPVTHLHGGSPTSEQIARAVTLLEEAHRPLIVAGSGAFYAGAEQAVADFAAAYGVPVAVPIWDRGVVVGGMEEFMGVIGAASGGPTLLEEVDLVMLLGAEVDYRVGYLQSPPLAPGTRVIQIDADASRLGRQRPADLEILADPGIVLAQLEETCIAREIGGFEDWLTEVKKRRDEFRRNIAVGAQQSEEKLHALDIIAALEKTLTPETVLVVDGGNIGQWFHQTLGRERYPGHWLTCGASGVVGFGIPGAMAARVGFPRRPVVLLSGDGSATFTLSELECAARQGLPFVMIVADDESWGIVEVGQVPRYGEPLNSHLGAIDFAQVARGLGALGARAETREELEQMLQRALGENAPVLIQVPITGGLPGT